jgi:hypothetical protein
VAIHAALTKELSGSQYPDHRLLALLGLDSHLDLTFLNVKHRARDIALLEHVLIFMEFQYLLSRAHFSNTSFPAPTLARKFLGSNMPLSGFSTGASFGSTNFIQV